MQAFNKRGGHQRRSYGDENSNQGWPPRKKQKYHDRQGPERRGPNRQWRDDRDERYNAGFGRYRPHGSQYHGHMGPIKSEYDYKQQIKTELKTEEPKIEDPPVLSPIPEIDFEGKECAEPEEPWKGCVYIGNLPAGVSKNEIAKFINHKYKEIYLGYPKLDGKIIACSVRDDQFDAFVEFKNGDHEKFAKNALNDKNFRGEVLEVKGTSEEIEWPKFRSRAQARQAAQQEQARLKQEQEEKAKVNEVQDGETAERKRKKHNQQDQQNENELCAPKDVGASVSESTPSEVSVKENSATDSALKKEMIRMKEEMVRMKEEMKEVKKERDDFRKDLRQVKNERTLLNLKKEELEQELEREREEADTKRDNFLAELEEWKELDVKQKKKIEEQKKQMGEQLKQIEELTAKLSKAQQDLQRAQEEKDENLVEAQNLRVQSHKNQELSNEVQDLQNRLVHVKEESGESAFQNAAIKKKLRTQQVKQEYIEKEANRHVKQEHIKKEANQHEQDSNTGKASSA